MGPRQGFIEVHLVYFGAISHTLNKDFYKYSGKGQFSADTAETVDAYSRRDFLHIILVNLAVGFAVGEGIGQVSNIESALSYTDLSTG